MIGTILLVIAAAISIIGVVKDNKPKDGEKAILGLNRTGFALLILVILTFVFGFTKGILDSISSAKVQSELMSRLDTAEQERDQAKNKLDRLQASLDTAESDRDNLESQLVASRHEVANVKTDLSHAIDLATTGMQREIDHPVVRRLGPKATEVISQVTGRPLLVKPGDEIHYFFYNSQKEGVWGVLRVGKRDYMMQTDKQGRGSIRVVGNEGQILPVMIRAVSPILPSGGIKMTVKSSYTPDILTPLRQTLDSNQPQHLVPKK